MSEPTPPGVLPRPVLAALAKAKAWFRVLPRAARILLVTTAAAGLLFGGGAALLKANESYVPLFTQLDREDASTIIAKLKEMKVPYRVEADGTSVEVPESKARELRLELAGAGLPRGGGVGFESFDKMRLGATDFEQRVLYRRALEGELSRTIGTIASVESSRVHLVLPEKSVFVTKSEPASASIVLHLRPGRTLGPSEVAGIVHLVASAVPSLDADHVAVVTTEGTMLHRPRRPGADGEDVGGEEGHAAARTYEASIEDRVRAMLERVVGVGHADVRVTADLDPAHVEHVEEHYDPTRTVLRSEERSVERQSGELDESVAGVPGAESNLPMGAAKGEGSAKPAASAAPSAAVANATPVRESHTRNYEVDHVTDRRVLAGGALRRLTVAVVVDGAKGGERPREEMDRLTALVKSAAGVSDTRGDVVTVESMAFAVPEPSESTAAPATPVSTSIDKARKWAPVGAGALFLLVVVGMLMRRRRGAKTVITPALAAPEAAPVAALPAAMAIPALDSGDLRASAHARATQDPATAALVLRFWLGTATPEVPERAKAS